MSNYSQFFPEGDTNIKRNPDDLPIVGIMNGAAGEDQYSFYTKLSYSATSSYNAGSSGNHLLGTSDFATTNQASATLTANTETTLLNITSGSGYLCNVISARNDLTQGASQGVIEITIIVDGTTYTYSFDYDNATSTTRSRRVLWGYANMGDFRSYNQPNDTTAVGLYGNGGWGIQDAATLTTLPPDTYQNASTSNSIRVFHPQEFSRYNLPRLRFDSSLVVKVKNETLSTYGDTYDTKAAALYYLDTQAM